MTRDRVFQTTRQVEKENPKGGKYTNTIVGQGSAQLTSNQHPREIDKMTFDFRAKGSDEVVEQKTFTNQEQDASPVVSAVERANELSKELGKPVTAYEVADTTAKSAQAKDYNYEIVNLGDVNLGVVDKFYATDKQDADKTFDKWLEMKGLPNDTSNYGYRPRKQEKEVKPNVAQNFTAQQGEQEVDGTGEPIWEIYQVGNGLVMSSFTAADQREAADALQDQLNDWGTDDDVRELYAVRPKMATTETTPPDATEQTGTWQLVDVTLNQPVETFQGTWAEADRIARQYETGPGERNGHEISVRRA